jgi:hypothetical protein
MSDKVQKCPIKSNYGYRFCGNLIKNLSHEKRISKMPNLIRWTQPILEGSKIVLFFKLFKKMKKSSLVKLSLATVVTAIALSITPNEEIKASSAGLRVYSNGNCSGDGGNCLDTVVVKPNQD